MILCAITPIFLTVFLFKNRGKISDQTFIGAYTFLVKDFKESIYCIYFNVIFLVRRIAIVVSVHVLHSYPIAQVVVCSIVCWIVISI